MWRRAAWAASIVICGGVVLGTIAEAQGVVSNIRVVDTAEWARSPLLENISETNLAIKVDRRLVLSSLTDHPDCFNRKIMAARYRISRVHERAVIRFIGFHIGVREIMGEARAKWHFFPTPVNESLCGGSLTGVSDCYGYEIPSMEGTYFFDLWRRRWIATFAVQFEGFGIHSNIGSKLQFARFDLSAEGFSQRAIRAVQFDPLPDGCPNQQALGNGSQNGAKPIQSINNVVEVMVDDDSGVASGLPYRRFWWGGTIFALGFILCIVAIGQRRPDFS